jgi:hypothetical protein
LSALSNGSLARRASDPVAATRIAGSQRLAATSPWLIAAAAIVGALVVQLARSTNPDVSWLLTLNDRMLAGAQPYVGIVEVNPPASILLYTPAVILGKALSLSAETVLMVLLTALIAGTLLFAARTIRRYQMTTPANGLLVLSTLAFVVAVLPLSEFAQREHFATLFMLPYAFVAIARAKGAKIAGGDGALSGLMLGLAIAIKPHFALCVLFVAGFEILRSRSFRLVFSIEHLIGAGVVIAYLIASLVFFPKFFSDMTPILADLYLPTRNDLPYLIAKISFATLPALALCWIYRSGAKREGTVVCLLIAAGFFAAYLIQGKGWDNHAYPVVAFCLIGAAWAAQQAMAHEAGGSRTLAVVFVAAAVLVAIPRFDKPGADNPALAAVVSRLTPHPKLLALGFVLRLGHPLTRDIGGTWIGSAPCLWMTGGAMMMKDRVGDDAASRARADAYFERDRLTVAHDIETQRPDIVLIEKTYGFDFPQWIAGSPPLTAAMERYDLAETVGKVQVFKRRSEPAT